jgi:hypothetical protein
VKVVRSPMSFRTRLENAVKSHTSGRISDDSNSSGRPTRNE